MNMEFNDWLKQCGISKTEFCEKAGVDRQNLHNWLSGNVAPRMDKVMLFAHGVSLYDKDINPLEFFVAYKNLKCK